jgi:prolyl 4-hydroxylase
MKLVVFALIGLVFYGCNTGPKPSSERTFDMDVLSWQPRVFFIKDLLSEQECNELIALAESNLQRSSVVANDSTENEIINTRTSQGYSLERKQNEVVAAIEKRFSMLTMLPEENGENIQVLLYQPGGEYQPHHDYFDSDTIGGRHELARGGQRIASLVIYLNTPEEGGQTVFPMLGINVTPQKGGALLFYDCTLDGKEDPLTLHGGAPVLKGQKWIATMWFRQGPFH